MKTLLIHILPIALLLCSCAQIEDTLVDENILDNEFCVYLSEGQTKTVNDGISTQWVEGDVISLFHAVAGSSDYVNDNAFTCDNVTSNKFSGNLTEELDANSCYDWYAFYPLETSCYPNAFNTYIGRTEMASFVGSNTQSGNDSMFHLAGGQSGCPIVGFVKNVPATDYPTIVMRNLASVIAVNITNTLDESIVVNSVDLVAPKSILGQYVVDLSGDEPVITESSYQKKLVRLEVSEGSPIAKGESAKFYFGVAPFTAETGSEILLYLNAKVGENEFSQRAVKVLSSEIDFKPGYIKTFNVDYSKSVSVPVDVNKDDFYSLNLGETFNNVKSGNKFVSFDGWTVETGGVMAGTSDIAIPTLAALIGGKSTEPGKLTSPLLADGCSTLSFKYCPGSNLGKTMNFKIEIMDESGEVKWTDTVNYTAADKNEICTYSKSDINVSGSFRIVFTNLVPSQKTNFLYDRFAIFDVEWTNPQ